MRTGPTDATTSTRSTAVSRGTREDGAGAPASAAATAGTGGSGDASSSALPARATAGIGRDVTRVVARRVRDGDNAAVAAGAAVTTGAAAATAASQAASTASTAAADAATDASTSDAVTAVAASATVAARAAEAAATAVTASTAACGHVVRGSIVRIGDGDCLRRPVAARTAVAAGLTVSAVSTPAALAAGLTVGVAAAGAIGAVEAVCDEEPPPRPYVAGHRIEKIALVDVGDVEGVQSVGTRRGSRRRSAAPPDSTGPESVQNDDRRRSRGCTRSRRRTPTWGSCS